MSNLFEMLEDAAARGAAGLAPEARESVASALRALQRLDGGFAGLDGRPDMYFSLFAWLSLRALGAPFERERLCAYAEAQARGAKGVDALCAGILLAREGRRRRGVGWLAVVGAVLCGGTRDVYGAFLRALAANVVPRWLARLAWRRQRRLFATGAAERLPTPRLAAGLVLAALAGAGDCGILPVLLSRQCAGGGFASAEGAPADLLATAVARFACGCAAAAGQGRAGVAAGRTGEDLAFIEACWLEDGLFGPSPRASRGDAEHTFYGLLALGTCRAASA